MLQREVENRYNIMFDRERDMWVATEVFGYTPADTSLPAYPKINHPDPQYHGVVLAVPNYTLHVEEAIKAIEHPLPNGHKLNWVIRRTATAFIVEYSEARKPIQHANLTDALCLAALCARLVDEVDENDWIESTVYF